jgi:hypothetical protein
MNAATKRSFTAKAPRYGRFLPTGQAKDAERSFVSTEREKK